MSTLVTIWTVYRTATGPRLTSAQGRKTAKQVKLTSYSRGFDGVIVQLRLVHESPAAAIEAWRVARADDVASALVVLSRAQSLRDASIDLQGVDVGPEAARRTS